MEITTRNSLSTTHASNELQIAKILVDQKQSVDVGSISATVNAQVLTAPARLSLATMTSTQLKEYLDTSKFSEAESQAVMGLFFASAVMVDKEQSGAVEQDTVSELMSFDPGAWEKHVGVLMAAIVAVNIARKSSAEMSGVFTQMAFESSKAQGVAIMAGGEASMWAAVSGAVVATTMAVGGAGLSIKGQNRKHEDIKTNHREAANLDLAAEQKRVELRVGSTEQRSTPKKFETVNESLELQKGSGKVESRDRGTIESEIRIAVAHAKELRLKSALTEKKYSRDVTVGGALSAMSMVMSAGLSSILRLQEYSERQTEVLRQAEQGVNKSASESANQMISQDTALISKMLDAIQQMVDSRASTMSAVASVRA